MVQFHQCPTCSSMWACWCCLSSAQHQSGTSPFRRFFTTSSAHSAHHSVFTLSRDDDQGGFRLLRSLALYRSSHLAQWAHWGWAEGSQLSYVANCTLWPTSPPSSCSSTDCTCLSLSRLGRHGFPMITAGTRGLIWSRLQAFIGHRPTHQLP